jgi:hypothetical protein
VSLAYCLMWLTANVTAITPSGSHALATSPIEGEARELWMAEFYRAAAGAG